MRRHEYNYLTRKDCPNRELLSAHVWLTMQYVRLANVANGSLSKGLKSEHERGRATDDETERNREGQTDR